MSKQGDESKLKADPLVDQIVGDPNSPRRSRLLQGFVGDSATDGYTRLYLDPQFSWWVEIPKSSILATKTAESRGTPIETTFAWVSIDAELKWHPRSRSTTAPSPTQVDCPPITEFPVCPGITYFSSCPPTYDPYCPAPTYDCSRGGYFGPRYPTITVGCPPITTAACPPQTIHTDCPTPSYNLPCPSQGPCPTADCPVPTDDCGWGGYFRPRYPTMTVGCPPITTAACPPQTIHTDCPTPSYNLPCPSQGPCPTAGCPVPTDDCGWGGFRPRGGRSRQSHRFRRLW
jgi:hypothetical protein